MSGRVKRPIEIDDLLHYSFLSDPQISPDGKQVAFVVRTVSDDRLNYQSAIWVVDSAPARVNEPRQLSAGAKVESTPRWSPDGKWLAFTSDRAGGKPQLWLMPGGGGPERQLTDFVDGLAGLTWAPDSSSVCCVVKEWVDTEDRPPDGEQPRVRVIDRIRYKLNGEGFLTTRKHLYRVTLSSEARRLTDGDWDDTEPSWSPDGQTIAFVSCREPDRDTSFNSDIWLLDLETSSTRRLGGADGEFWAPAWSPDGHWIAFIGHQKPPETGPTTSATVWVAPREGGSPRALSSGRDRDVGSTVLSDMRGSTVTPGLAWRPDSDSIRFLTNDRGSVGLEEVTLDGSQRRLRMGGRQIVSFSSARDGALALDVTDPTSPGDVFLTTPTGSDDRRLTWINGDWLGDRAIEAPEPVNVVSADGCTLDAWLLKPPGFDPRGRYPLVLNVHGGPHAAYGWSYYHELQVLAAQGHLVLYANPHYSVGYGQHFVTGVRGDWGGQDYDDLMRVVDFVVERPYVDRDRLGVLGGSFGGFMTNWIIGHTDRFRAAISDRSTCDRASSFGTADIHFYMNQWEFLGRPWEQRTHYSERSPITYVEKITTPLLLVHGEQDLRCPVEQAEQLFTSLKSLGRDVVMVRYPEENHELSRTGRPDRRLDRLRRMVTWLDRWLKPTTAT